MSLVEDEVSSRKMPLSATFTSCSVLNTPLAISRFVMISVAVVAEAMRQLTVAARIPIRTFMRVLHFREAIAAAKAHEARHGRRKGALAGATWRKSSRVQVSSG